MSAAGEQVLWRSFVAPGVVGLWDGALMKTYAFAGADITAASMEDRLQRCERLNSLFRQYGRRWSWLVEGQNTPVKRYPYASWPTRASALLDAERHANAVANGQQFAMKHYLTLVQDAPSRLGTIMTTALTSGESRRAQDIQIDEFRRSADEFAKAIQSIGTIDELDDDATATYLHSTGSTSRHPVRADDHEILSETLLDEKFSRGLGFSRLGNNYFAVCTLGGFPKTSHPQLLEALSRLPFEFRWTTRWIAMDHGEAKQMMLAREEKALGSRELLKDQLIKYFEGLSKNAPKKSPNDTYHRRDREAEQSAESAGDAMTRLSTRGFGLLTTTFMLWDKDPNVLIERRLRLRDTVRMAKLVIRDEKLEPVKVWRMSMPGNRERGRRTFPMSTRNLADLLPTSSLWHGAEFDAELASTTGVRRPWMYTADPVPFGVCTDVEGGAAHACVFGATGKAGKSTLINHFGMQFFGYPNAQVISISIGRSEYGPCILNGGAVYDIGSIGGPSFQPLAHADQQQGALQALQWLKLCLESVGVDVTPRRSETLSKALQLLATKSPRHRTMTEYVKDLKTRDPDLAIALKPYTLEGRAYGHIFDGDNADVIGWRRWTMFDISNVIGMRKDAAVPALAQLLSMVTSRFDGRPTLVICEEIQEWLHFEQLRKLVAMILDTQRKNNVRALLGTLTPAKLAPYGELFSSIKSACATKIYGPDAEVKSQAELYRELGVTDPEIDRIGGSPESMRLGQYLLRNAGGSRVFRLLDAASSPIALAMTGMSKPAQLTMLAEMRAACDNEDELLDRLLAEKKLTERAKKLERWHGYRLQRDSVYETGGTDRNVFDGSDCLVAAAT